MDVVARVLRVRQERLGRLADAREEEARAGPAAEFVEIALPVEVAGSVFVQFEAPDGRRLQLEVPSTSACDVGAIFAAFAGRPR